jgi:endonuclease/exonuclease/phosphatase family metal-dependent hydrolase
MIASKGRVLMKSTRLLRRLATALALFGVLTAPWGPAAHAAEPQAKDRPLRVMSWNIGYTWTNGVLDYPAVAEAIQAADPDVVGVQEILRGCGDRYGYDDQVAILADLLDMHVYFSPVQADSAQGEGEPRCQLGNAVFSRYPILEADYKILPWSLVYRRGLQDVLVNVRGVPVRVYNTHLQNNPTSPQAKQDRTDQVRAVLAHAGELEEATVLTGDLNANPDWSEIQPLFGVFHDSGWPAGTAVLGTRWASAVSTTDLWREGCRVYPAGESLPRL